MTVFKKRGRWVSQAYDPTTQRMRQIGTYPTRRDAKVAETAAKATPDAGYVPTIAEWRERWLEDFRRPKASTNITNAQQTLVLAREYGARPVNAISVIEALAWAKRHQSALNGVRAMLNDARRAGVLTGDNPFAGLGLEQSRGRRDLPSEWLTVADVDHLADCAVRAVKDEGWAPTLRAMILFAAYTGLRPGEMFAVQWADLNLAAREIEVKRAASSTSREITLPKNGLRRIVPLPDTASAHLDTVTRFHEQPVVFASPTGRQFWGSTFHRYWDKARCLAGRPACDFYELRHFCATHLLELGLPSEDVAEQLGHEDGGALVRERYGHPSKKAARARILAATDRQVTSISTATRKAG